MKLFITGSTGFLGGALVRRLKKSEANITATGRNMTAGKILQARGVQFLPLDLTDAEGIEAACQGQDIVVHCGALSAPWGKYQDFYQANVVGTENIIRGCQKHQVKRLIYISTPSIYFGYEDRVLVKEDDPLPDKPINAYAHTKRLAEQAIDRAHQEGLPVITLRPRAIFGPGDRAIFPRLLRVMEQGQLPIIGTGENYIDLTYIDNVVDAILLCMESPATTLGQKYNISNGESIRLWSLMRRLCIQLGYPPPKKQISFGLAFRVATVLEWLYKSPFFKGEPLLTRYGVTVLAKTQTINIKAARQELGYQPRIAVEEGMRRFIHWWTQRQ